MDTPLPPKDLYGPLRVLLVARSSAGGEAEHMLDASLAHMEDQIRRAYDWPVRFEAVDVEQDGRTSWLLEFRLQQLLASEGFDAVVIEELSRISRDPEGIRRFVETCTSAGVRVLCTAERFDTANMCDS